MNIEFSTFLFPLQAHHKHAKFLNKMIEMYDKLALVVGKDMAQAALLNHTLILTHNKRMVMTLRMWPTMMRRVWWIRATRGRMW